MRTPRSLAENHLTHYGESGRWVVTLDIASDDWAGVLERPGALPLLIHAKMRHADGSGGLSYGEFRGHSSVGSDGVLVVTAYLKGGTTSVQTRPAARREACANGVWLAAFAPLPRGPRDIRFETIDGTGRRAPWDLWPEPDLPPHEPETIRIL